MSLSYMIPVLESIQDDGVITQNEVVEITSSIVMSMISAYMFYKLLSFTSKTLNLSKEERKPLKVLKHI